MENTNNHGKEEFADTAWGRSLCLFKAERRSGVCGPAANLRPLCPLPQRRGLK